MTESRYFFHTFPRGRKNEASADTLSRALKILRLMKEVGLVLAPENVEWKIPAEAGTQRLAILQRRACLPN
jgi:hypothetical protein